MPLSNAKPVVHYKNGRRRVSISHRVSPLGEVWTCHQKIGKEWQLTKEWRQLKLGNVGYNQVWMYFRSDYCIVLVHHAVLYTFRGPRPKGTEGSHLNDNPYDNRLSNLIWETHAENVQRGLRNAAPRKRKRLKLTKRTGPLLTEEEKIKKQAQQKEQIPLLP